MTRVLFPGRFQPPHNGHMDCIEQLLKEFDEVDVLFGSKQYSGIPRNPLTVHDRTLLCARACEERGISERVCATLIEDFHDFDAWIAVVEKFLKCARNTAINRDKMSRKMDPCAKASFAPPVVLYYEGSGRRSHLARRGI